MGKAVFASAWILIAIPIVASLQPVQKPEAAAASVQAKIDTIKKAEKDKKHTPQKLDVSEPELEAYVITTLKKQLPVQLESIRVHLTPGVIGADARLTFAPGSTGNFIVDAIISGTHNFLLKGKLTGAGGRGKFDLQDVYIDGIPVPNFLTEVLIRKFVKPKYPDTDLNAPFDLPWGIDAINIVNARATITY